jgi:Tol biopolymer transport system component
MSRLPRLTRIGKLVFVVNAVCAALLLFALGISRTGGKGLFIAYPLNGPCNYGNCAVDIGLLDPNTGQKFAFKVGRIFDTAGLQASSDGQIVYINTNGIYLLRADGAGHQRLDVASGQHVAWSPDGKQLAFLLGGLRVIDADGGNLRQLTRLTVWGWPAWSPDGKQLAFEVRPPNSLYSEETELYLVNSDGTNLRQVTRNNFGDFFPQWSPDGQHLLVLSVHDRRYNIDLMGIDGKTRIALAEGIAPRWVLGGQSLLYARVADPNPAPSITLMLLDLARGTSTELLTRSNLAGLQVSPDGRRFVYSIPDNDNPTTGKVCIFILLEYAEQCFPGTNKYLDSVAIWVPLP